MTLAELQRFFESRHRVDLRQAQERASFDYILTQLFTRGVGCLFSSDATMPTIFEVYPTLFEQQQQQQKEKKLEQQALLSSLRFRQFADDHNKRFSKKGCESE
jgi:hypothetical protein